MLPFGMLLLTMSVRCKLSLKRASLQEAYREWRAQLVGHGGEERRLGLQNNQTETLSNLVLVLSEMWEGVA